MATDNSKLKAQSEALKTGADEANVRKNIMRAIGVVGGGAAGYLGSKYLMDINDTPLNLLAGGVGAGAGLVGAEFLNAQGDTERAEESGIAKKIDTLKAKQPESIVQYHMNEFFPDPDKNWKDLTNYPGTTGAIIGGGAAGGAVGQHYLGTKAKGYVAEHAKDLITNPAASPNFKTDLALGLKELRSHNAKELIPEIPANPITGTPKIPEVPAVPKKGAAKLGGVLTRAVTSKKGAAITMVLGLLGIKDIYGRQTANEAIAEHAAAKEEASKQ